MNGAVSAFREHRDDPRVSARSPARFAAPRAIFAPSGPALIEEFSACGLRLRTESQLHPDEELVVKVEGEPFPLHARVVWVREAPPLHRRGHKTWNAGCRLEPDSIGRVRLGPAVVDVRTPFSWRKPLQILGLTGALALVVYLFLRFATLLGGG
ncbi:MAG TPA: PilZ domain-containing protein [Planctomycetota bacterium]|nr:PilZ domain-containing protein [Planctomycetota bacterium]